MGPGQACLGVLVGWSWAVRGALRAEGRVKKESKRIEEEVSPKPNVFSFKRCV